jgi:hypothetical protein
MFKASENARPVKALLTWHVGGKGEPLRKSGRDLHCPCSLAKLKREAWLVQPLNFMSF